VSIFLPLVSSLLSFFLIFQTEALKWKEYTSQLGKFTVLLPGEPTTAYRPVTGDSNIYINHITNVQTPAANYSIGFFDIPVDFTESGNFNQLFNNTRYSIIKLYSLELQEEAEILWRGYPGRSWRMTSSDEKQFLTIIFLVKKRVYYLTVILPNNQNDLSDVGKFYESFKPILLTDDDLKNLEISEIGQVIEAQVIKGPNGLHETSLQAAKQWRFKPVLLGGKAIKIEGVLRFNFAVPYVR
jgi:Gram-negative bacterial TonB protein C-terminal